MVLPKIECFDISPQGIIVALSMEGTLYRKDLSVVANSSQYINILSLRPLPEDDSLLFTSIDFITPHSTHLLCGQWSVRLKFASVTLVSPGLKILYSHLLQGPSDSAIYWTRGFLHRQIQFCLLGRIQPLLDLIVIHNDRIFTAISCHKINGRRTLTQVQKASTDSWNGALRTRNSA